MNLHFTTKDKKILMSALVLFVCVTLTGVALFDRLGGFLLDDSGAILLIPDMVEVEQQMHNNTEIMSSTSTAVTSGTKTTVSKGKPVPSYNVSDEDGVWSTDTRINIFKISYENGQQMVTVNSDNGEKVIAPGTKNSYTFKLSNNGDRPVDYIVTIDAYFSPADMKIPVTVRMNRYDGKWIVGGQEKWADVPALDAAEDEDTLSAGKYTYYTLDWQWPFESGNDTYDTMLGDLAAEQDLEFTIVINTIAAANESADDSHGITPPKTGDHSNMVFLMAAGIGSFAIIILLNFGEGREKSCKGK